LDNAYDRAHIRQHLQNEGLTPVIPPKQNRNAPNAYATDELRSLVPLLKIVDCLKEEARKRRRGLFRGRFLAIKDLKV